MVWSGGKLEPHCPLVLGAAAGGLTLSRARAVGPQSCWEALEKTTEASSSQACPPMSPLVIFTSSLLWPFSLTLLFKNFGLSGKWSKSSNKETAKAL